MRIAPKPSRPTVGPPPNVSVPGLATGVVWSDMIPLSPLLPGGWLVVGRRIAVIGRHIAGWVGRGRCGTGCSANGDTRGNANAEARSDDGRAAINIAAIDRSANGGSAIGTARCGGAGRG